MTQEKSKQRELLLEKCRDAREDVLATFPDINRFPSVMAFISGNFISNVMSGVVTDDIDVFVCPVVTDDDPKYKENILINENLDKIVEKLINVADYVNGEKIDRSSGDAFTLKDFEKTAKDDVIEMQGYVTNFASYKMANKGVKTGIPTINIIVYSDDLCDSVLNTRSFYGSETENALRIVNSFDFQHASWFYIIDKDILQASDNCLDLAKRKMLKTNETFFWKKIKSYYKLYSGKALEKQFRRIAHYRYDYNFEIDDKSLAELIYIFGNRDIFDYDDWKSICNRYNFV